MADATATISFFNHPQGFDTTNRNIVARGTIALSTGHYPVGGFSLNWLVEQIKSQFTGVQKDSVKGNVTQLPTEVDVWSAANPPSGYSYAVDRSVGNLHILVPSNGASGASGPMVEYGGNLVTAQINDVIQFCAIFPKNI